MLHFDALFTLDQVQGHVDTTVTIHSIIPDPPNSVLYTFKVADTQFLTYIVHKGYVCLDGTSLTVVSVNAKECTFSVMLIQYTQEHVIMPLKKIGDRINLEVDQVGKYVENVVVGMMTHHPQIEALIQKMVLKTLTRDEKI